MVAAGLRSRLGGGASGHLLSRPAGAVSCAGPANGGGVGRAGAVRARRGMTLALRPGWRRAGPPRTDPSLCGQVGALVVLVLRKRRAVVASGQARPGFHDPGLKPAYVMGLGPGSWKSVADDQRTPSSPGSARSAAVGGRQLCPSNRLVTDPSLKTSLIARASSGAIESTVSLSNRFSFVIGIVLQTITSLIREFFSMSTAGPDSTPCVAVTIT